MTNELKNPPCFASRLNSMGERLDLWSGNNNVLGWIARQGTIKGLKLVDFNSPQHLEGLTVKEVTSALENVSLRTGAVCTDFLQISKAERLQILNHQNAELPLTWC